MEDVPDSVRVLLAGASVVEYEVSQDLDSGFVEFRDAVGKHCLVAVEGRTLGGSEVIQVAGHVTLRADRTRNRGKPDHGDAEVGQIIGPLPDE